MAKYSGRIHDPNHNVSEYDIYFNETKIQTGTDYSSDYESIITRDGTSITIPDGITTIGPNALRGMSNLRSVYIPDGVERIQSNAFTACTSLEEIYLPASITSITFSAFTSVNSNIVIKCGFSENAVSGAPWSAPEGATVLYDQERPAAVRSANHNVIHSGINTDLLTEPERPDIVKESEINPVISEQKADI